ncbi:sensor histidine kinase [Celeribacter sp. SCSIO 80788]|uniref:sensor histidine kinase n=1 Tax=Celeribacter sp. SCSIO 80788 TaxID=3117013 RepID=UPI003DA2F461
MKIRAKLLVSHGFVALVVGCICVLILIGLQATDDSRHSFERSYESLREINELNSDANRLSEQIAELFTVGLEGRDEVIQAYDHLIAQLDGLHTALEGDLAQAEPEHRESAEAMLDWITELQTEVEALGAVGVEIFDLLSKGQREVAQSLYARRVEDDLDTSIGTLIDEAIRRNARSVTAEIDAWNELTERQRLLAISIVVTAALVAVGTALLLDKQVSRPLADLSAAADNLASGHGEIALDTRRSDELGDLAERFQEMVQRISEQQASLRAARDSLAEQVSERTESLSQRTEQLEAANARLRELDSSRTQFLADISHELRTPLTVMRGQAEVALRNPNPSSELLQAAMQAMVRKTGQLGQLVDDLLFLARSEAGAIQVIPSPTMLQETLAEVTMDARSLRAADGIRIALHQPEDPVMVDADPARLHQAVMIILDNAIRHAPRDSVVSIDLKRSDDMAYLSISDMGEGFHEADIPHVFDRFYRGRNSRGAGGKGSGLGLAIAYWIVSRHHGRISIGQAENGTNGARVDVILPLLTETDGTDRHA